MHYTPPFPFPALVPVVCITHLLVTLLCHCPSYMYYSLTHHPALSLSQLYVLLTYSSPCSVIVHVARSLSIQASATFLSTCHASSISHLPFYMSRFKHQPPYFLHVTLQASATFLLTCHASSISHLPFYMSHFKHQPPSFLHVTLQASATFISTCHASRISHLPFYMSRFLHHFGCLKSKLQVMLYKFQLLFACAYRVYLKGKLQVMLYKFQLLFACAYRVYLKGKLQVMLYKFQLLFACAYRVRFLPTPSQRQPIRSGVH